MGNYASAQVEECGYNSLKSFYESEKKFLKNGLITGIEIIETCLYLNYSVLRGFYFVCFVFNQFSMKEEKRAF